MNNRILIGLLSFCCVLGMAASVRRVSLSGYDLNLRQDHPRLFVNQEMLPEVRSYAAAYCAKPLAELRQKVSGLPDQPKLELVSERYRAVPGGIEFVRPYSEGWQIARHTFLSETQACAVVWLLDGDRVALRRGIAHLREMLRLMEWCAAHRVMTEWHGTIETNALVAWDWMYAGMTESERRELGTALLRNVAFIQGDGGADYRRCVGGPQDGNYGTSYAEWLGGLTFYGEGYDDALALKLLEHSFKNNLAMMDYRDKLSADSGLLSAATHGYSFGMYPFATFFFLHNLKSALGVDWSNRWSQMRHYPNWFNWMKIQGKDGRLLTYGVGDTYHYSNALAVWLMFSHMMETMHFYPELAPHITALIACLPEKARTYYPSFGFLKYVLTGCKQLTLKASPALRAQPEAAFFPSFGLVFSRSGNRTEDTHAMFRCGARYGNHQHFDEGSFVIFKREFLALDAGSRTQSAHHCMFAPQTVAHNAVLIHMDQERIAPFWRPWGSTAETIPDHVPMHGGQYRTVGAKALAFRHTDDYTFAANDMTGVYRKEKCRRAIRRFVHVQPDVFVIFDQVESVKAEQDKECLLHTQNEPVDCGHNVFRAERGDVALFQQTLLPLKAKVVKLGGPGKQFWASGRNWPLPEGEKEFLEPNNLGAWRLETKAPTNQAAVEFLHVLEATEAKNKAMIPVKLINQGKQVGVELVDRNGKRVTVLFEREKPDTVTVTTEKVR